MLKFTEYHRYVRERLPSRDKSVRTHLSCGHVIGTKDTTVLIYKCPECYALNIGLPLEGVVFTETGQGVVAKAQMGRGVTYSASGGSRVEAHDNLLQQIDEYHRSTYIEPEQHPSRGSKLSRQDARDIRYVYHTGRWKQREIAERYGVAQQSISTIITGKAYNE